MMAKPADPKQTEEAAATTADFGRLAADMLQTSAAGSVHPLMAHPAAAMAAATAIGFGFSTQMMGAFMGAVQGAMEATQRFADAFDPQKDRVATPSNAVCDQVKPITIPKAVVSLSTEKQTPPAEVRVKARPGAKKVVKQDDLKLISGVGPKLVQVLANRGIARFADIAAWTAVDIERIDSDFGFGGRIARDDWVGQAKALLRKSKVKA